MKKYLSIFAIIGIISLLVLFNRNSQLPSQSSRTTETVTISGAFDESKLKSDEEWKEILTEDQYHILREEGTERPFTGKLLDNKEKGVYMSAGCDIPVFSSETKYDSKTGWPSFTQPIDEDVVVLKEDYKLGYKRIEVLDKCGGHLGHLFDDGPEPTGNRYCINSDALVFVPEE